MDNIFFNKYSTIEQGDKKGWKSSFVDKICPKTGVIHNISTKCGYMDSNNVEMWITRIPQYLVKKNFEIQYIEVQKSFFYKARRASRRAACGLPFGSIYLSARVCISCFRGDFPLKQRLFNNFYLTCHMKIYIIRMLFTTQSSRMARRRNCLWRFLFSGRRFTRTSLGNY